MRLGGAYTLGQPAVPITLKSGQQFYLPPGNYMVTLGTQTVLQYFDPNQLLWRGIGQPGNNFSVMDSDGSNFRLVNFSGVATGGLITNAGSGAVNGIGPTATGVTISFGAAPTSGVAATAYPIVGGQISSTINIAQAGSGFVVPPAILIDPPPQGGIQASAICTISGGAINAVTVVNQGAGYLSTPNVYVLPQYATFPGIGPPVNIPAPTSTIPPGLVAPVLGIQSYPPFLATIDYPAAPGTTGALLQSAGLAGSGTLTGLVMTNYGANYVSTPTVTVTGAGAAAVTPIMSYCLVSMAITVAGAAYANAPIWQSGYGTVSKSDGNNGTYQPRVARGGTTVAAGAVSTVTIEDFGFGLQYGSNPNVGVIQTGGTPATTVATLTGTLGGVSDVSLVQQAVQ